MRDRFPTRLLPLLLLVAVSCSPSVGGAEQTLQEFYTHLNGSEYTLASALYSTEAREIIEDPANFTEGGFEEWAAELTKDGSVKAVDVVSQSDDASGTTLEYTVSYRDGSSNRHSVTMVQEGGEWRLGLIR